MRSAEHAGEIEHAHAVERARTLRRGSGICHRRDGSDSAGPYDDRVASTSTAIPEPVTPDPVTPERRRRTEALVVLEPARLALNGWRLVTRRAPVSRTVMVLPGRGANDATTAPLRAYLRSLGHEAHGWGIGINRGDVDENVQRLVPRLTELHDAARQRIVLAGWSLGGLVARELARIEPDRVSRVITFGTPVVGGAKYTALAATYRNRGMDLDEVERDLHRRGALAEHIAITSIYSRFDGVVSWPACIDRLNPQAENIEVVATHLGLGINHDVWRLIADRLARPD
jgi:pimeloyl-ACP methyl ester carboxylesterase